MDTVRLHLTTKLLPVRGDAARAALELEEFLGPIRHDRFEGGSSSVRKIVTGVEDPWAAGASRAHEQSPSMRIAGNGQQVLHAGTQLDDIRAALIAADGHLAAHVTDFETDAHRAFTGLLCEAAEAQSKVQQHSRWNCDDHKHRETR
jgi:hypothetical protein